MTTLYPTINDIKVGDKLPPLEIPITTSLIVGGAAVTNDFTQVHHDKKKAQAAGLPDVFMNILTSNGLMGTYITNWAGPASTTKSLDIKLGAPNMPGFIMTISGEITAIDTQTGLIDLAVLGENNVWGMHMQGTVQITLAGDA
jgi:hypothetical protein